MANKKDVSAQLQALVNEPLIMTNAQEAQLPYDGTVGNENQRWTFINRYWGGDIKLWYAGKPLVDLMIELNDPRLATYFDTNNTGVYAGKSQGATGGFAAVSKINTNMVLPDSPDRFSTASETYFLLADAASNGYVTGGLTQANTWFVEGVKLALDYFDGSLGEIDQASKDAYLASLPDLATLSTEAALDFINDQHYISLFGNGLEAWNQWKRTKSVNLEVPVNGTATGIIRRYTYSQNEANSNPNTPTNITVETPMWFEK